jgi:hypothetical protein
MGTAAPAVIEAVLRMARERVVVPALMAAIVLVEFVSLGLMLQVY